MEDSEELIDYEIEIDLVDSIIEARIPGVCLKFGTKLYFDPEFGDTKGTILAWDPQYSTVRRFRRGDDLSLIVPKELEDIYTDLPIRSYLLKTK